MQTTYTVRAADGQHYGPVPLDEIRQWTQEGRVSSGTLVNRSDSPEWLPAGNLPELGLGAPAALPTTGSLSSREGSTTADPALVAQLKGGASWFYWVAGLSVINTIAAFTGSSWGFILGLGITQVFDAIARQAASGIAAVALVMDLCAAGLFVLFGVFAHKRHTWSFVVGMLLYGLDGLLFLLAGDWLGLGFHAFVLFGLFRGLQACRSLNQS